MYFSGVNAKDMYQEIADQYMEYLGQYFQSNDGYHTKVPYKLSINHQQFLHVDSHFDDKGITRFQGVITGMNACVPIELFPLISNYHITTIYNIGSRDKVICWTIWFKEPLTQEKWDQYIKEQSLVDSQVY